MSVYTIIPDLFHVIAEYAHTNAAIAFRNTCRQFSGRKRAAAHYGYGRRIAVECRSVVLLPLLNDYSEIAHPTILHIRTPEDVQHLARQPALTQSLLSAVEHIEFGIAFTQGLVNAPPSWWPRQTRHIVFHSSMYDEPLDGLIPDGVESLSLQSSYSHSVDRAFPASLIRLKLNVHTLNRFYEHNLDNLPHNLRVLELQGLFLQPLDHLPNSLTTLKLRGGESHALDNLPMNLQHLHLAFYRRALPVTFPRQLRTLCLDISCDSTFTIDSLPHTLESISILGNYLRPINLPPSVRTIRAPSLLNLQNIPRVLESLVLTGLVLPVDAPGPHDHGVTAMSLQHLCIRSLSLLEQIGVPNIERLPQGLEHLTVRSIGWVSPHDRQHRALNTTVHGVPGTITRVSTVVNNKQYIFDDTTPVRIVDTDSGIELVRLV